jgi:predicted dehydrogenase
MGARARIALVGAGAMGANHARVISEADGADLAVIIDTDAARVRPLAERLGCAFAEDLDAAAGCDAAVIATPTAFHEGAARALLELGKPILVEKPVTPDLETSRALVACAERRGVPLMCGFVERFNPVVVTMRSLLDEKPVHIIGLRHSPATPRSTLSVVFDLLIHEIDLALCYMGGIRPSRVCGATSTAGRDSIMEVADCLLQFPDGAIATLSASRASQRKVRSQLVATSTALYDIDLLRQDLTVYRHRAHAQGVGDGQAAGYRAETVIDIPFVRHTGEPLGLQFAHFLDLVSGRADACAERNSILPAHEVAAAIEECS